MQAVQVRDGDMHKHKIHSTRVFAIPPSNAEKREGQLGAVLAVHGRSDGQGLLVVVEGLVVLLAVVVGACFAAVVEGGRGEQ